MDGLHINMTTPYISEVISLSMSPRNINTMNLDDAPKHSLGSDYLGHEVFARIKEYASFYDSLSFHISSWTTRGTTAVLNMDTHVYSSMHGTLESIHNTLLNGRVSDAYTLLRKFYDVTIINVYSNIYLEEKFDFDTYIVAQINDWLKGTKQIPEFRVMSQYIKKSIRLQPITVLLANDGTYKNVRSRCNDYTHYNFYKNLLINDNAAYLKSRPKALDTFIKDLDAIFIQHFAYLFYFKDHYMMATDYVDCLDMDLEPEENAQNFVANFIQEMFDKIVKVKRPDLAGEIKSNTNMQLK
jgi:hypothetical protein